MPQCKVLFFREKEGLQFLQSPSLDETLEVFLGLFAKTHMSHKKNNPVPYFPFPRDPGSPCQRMSKGCTITSETKGV